MPTRTPVAWLGIAYLGLASFAVLPGCGDAQDGAAPPLGSKVVGLAPSDPGILADATTYQPAKPPGATASPAGGGARGAATGGGGGGGDAETQVQATVEHFLAAVREGDIDAALGAFNPEHVAALADAKDAMVLTFERLDQFTRFLKEKADPTQVEQVLGPLGGGAAFKPQFELLDPQHASVTPNFAMILFGPVQPAPALRLELQDGQWRFQLAGPLTAADNATIKAFHERLQQALDALNTRVEESEKVDAAALATDLTQALGGQAPQGSPATQPADVPPREQDAPGAEPAPGESAPGPASPPGGSGPRPRGRVRPPG